MKSISPIIASILLIVITVAISLILYAFTSGIFGSLKLSTNNLVNQQSNIISFTINTVYCSNNILYFNIYNNGNIPININNSQIIFTDNYGNTISINGSNIICNNGNIIPSGSNSLCYIIDALCFYNYTNYIKSMNFIFNGISYSYNILSNNKFNLLSFYPYFFQSTNLTISSSNSQGYLAQLPRCYINRNPYSGGGSTGAIGTYGLLSCIAIQNSAISAIVWFYLPPSGQGVLLSFQTSQYPNDPNSYVPWLYVGKNGYLYAGDWPGYIWQISTPISTGWHMAVIEEWAASTSGPYYVALYLDRNYIGQSSTSNVPYLFGTNQAFEPSSSYDDIGTGFTAGGWSYGNGGWFFFNGTIAYVALYNTVLNQTQVQQLYQAGFPNTLFSNNLVISYILDPTYYNNNSYYFIPYYVNTQLMNQMGINNYNAISIIPNGSIGPIPSSQFIYEPNPPLS
ncbi:MAG: archaellin/type IV pilin N-terminal domain-containing protein [Candidatus Nanopusillus sp.]